MEDRLKKTLMIGFMIASFFAGCATPSPKTDEGKIKDNAAKSHRELDRQERKNYE